MSRTLSEDMVWIFLQVVSISCQSHWVSLALSDSLITKAEKENLMQTNFDYSHPSVIAT